MSPEERGRNGSLNDDTASSTQSSADTAGTPVDEGAVTVTLMLDSNLPIPYQVQHKRPG